MNCDQRQVSFTIYDKFLKKMIVIATMPIDPYKAIFGYYSGLCKDSMDAMAEVDRIPRSRIGVSVKIEPLKVDRLILRTRNNAVLDCPPDMNEKQITIIQHHLAGAKLALQD